MRCVLTYRKHVQSTVKLLSQEWDRAWGGEWEKMMMANSPIPLLINIAMTFQKRHKFFEHERGFLQKISNYNKDKNGSFIFDYRMSLNVIEELFCTLLLNLKVNVFKKLF